MSGACTLNILLFLIRNKTSCKKQMHVELILLNCDLLPERPLSSFEVTVTSMG